MEPVYHSKAMQWIGSDWGMDFSVAWWSGELLCKLSPQNVTFVAVPRSIEQETANVIVDYPNKIRQPGLATMWSNIWEITNLVLLTAKSKMYETTISCSK